jgi:hypothetical protein
MTTHPAADRLSAALRRSGSIGDCETALRHLQDALRAALQPVGVEQRASETGPGGPVATTPPDPSGDDTAPSEQRGLDEERLRTAGVNVSDRDPAEWLDAGDWYDALAAEYDRLAAQRTEDGT